MTEPGTGRPPVGDGLGQKDGCASRFRYVAEMLPEPGYNLSEVDAVKLRLLLDLTAADGPGQSWVPIAGLELGAGMAEAEDAGWIEINSVEEGPVRLRLLSAGQRVAVETRSGRQDSRARRRAAADALLGFLDDREPKGFIRRDQFEHSPWGSYYLDPFTPREVAQAEDTLVEKRLATASTAWGPLPALTTAGQELADRGGSVWDPPPGAPGGTTNYYSSVSDSTGVAVAQGSPGTIQTVAASQDEVKQVRALLVQVRALYGGDDVSDSQVAEVVQELEHVIARPRPDRGRLAHLVAKLPGALGNALVGAAVSPLVALVIAQAERLYRLLGG